MRIRRRIKALAEKGAGLGSEYVFLIISGILLLLGVTVFALLPEELTVRHYQVPVLSFLAALSVTAIANIVVGFIQTGVSKEAAKALRRPIEALDGAVDKLRQIQLFYEAGVTGIFPNRSSAMRKFRSEIEREDQAIDFVGTSLLGCLDPARENEERTALYELLMRKRKNGVRIRALLMHPAYGEFRERVENRERAAVARDIQATLSFLLARSETTDSSDGNNTSQREGAAEQNLLERTHIRLYPGVITAFAVFTSRSMLVNISSLHGPVYDNFTLIIDDTPDANSIFKKFKANHFEEPWRSEKSVRLDGGGTDVLKVLCDLDFADRHNRFKEGNWPPTIPKEVRYPGDGASRRRKARGSESKNQHRGS